MIKGLIIRQSGRQNHAEKKRRKSSNSHIIKKPSGEGRSGAVGIELQKKFIEFFHQF